jgi:hypothetical protein
MDVRTTFLNGEIEEEVYIKKLEGFMIHDAKYHMCRLKKALYGLKKTPRSWYEKLDEFLIILGFNKSFSDPNLYYHIVGDKCLILFLYVGDVFLIGSKRLIVECKRALNSEFEMKNLGMIHYFLGLEVWKRTSDSFLSQQKYTVKIFGMMDYKSVMIPSHYARIITVLVSF